MAKKAAPKKKTKAKAKPKERQRIRPIRWLLRWVRRVVFLTIAGLLLWIVAYSVINPPTTPYIVAERFRVGSIDRHWVPLEEIAPVMARSVVAAEDANFCNHWGLDLAAIKVAMDTGNGGASTISQQVVKNAYLWHGRSWFRKAAEAVMTPRGRGGVD